MICLPNVTLISLATRDIEGTIKALKHSSMGIKFGAIKLVTHERRNDAIEDHLMWGIETDYLDVPFETIDQWNRYVVYDLHKHFDTKHCLLVHADGFVVNPQSWKDEWLSYDYAGAPWSHECAIAIQGGRDQLYSRVGNSVGLRSHKLCKLPSEIGMEWKRYNADSNEDTFISCHNWRQFEEHGCTKMPFEEAIYFGREEQFPENDHIIEPFVFHKWWGKNSIYPRF